MRQSDHPRVTIISDLNAGWVQMVKNQSGKDIWLMGGGELFRSFLDAGCVDTVEVTVIPALLGSGVPLLPAPYKPAKLRLVSNKIYGSGIVSLGYEVQR
jgi:dihydrofolate reductase